MRSGAVLMAALFIANASERSVAQKAGTGGTVSGSVTSELTAAPLTCAAVSAGTRTYPCTNSNGRFVARHVPAGVAMLTVTRVGYTTVRRLVRLVDGAAERVDFQLTPARVEPMRLTSDVTIVPHLLPQTVPLPDVNFPVHIHES